MITPEHLKDLRDVIAAISLRDHGVGAPGSRHGVDVITAKWVRNHGVIKVLNVKFFRSIPYVILINVCRSEGQATAGRSE